jgi:rod shape-determining protein MreD
VLDNVLMPFCAIYGYYPSLVFVFIICYSIINGKWEGLWIGVAVGILQDIYFVDGFGINAFTNMITCVIAGEVGKNIFEEKPLIPVISILFISMLKGVMIYLLLYFVGQQSDIRNMLFSGLYNMIISIFMYRKIYKLCQKEYMKREWKF